MQNGYTAMDITKSHAMHHSLRALLVAGLITGKMGVSINVQESLYHTLCLRPLYYSNMGISEPFSSRRRYIYNKLLTTVLALDYIGCSSYSIN